MYLTNTCGTSNYYEYCVCPWWVNISEVEEKGHVCEKWPSSSAFYLFLFLRPCKLFSFSSHEWSFICHYFQTTSCTYIIRRRGRKKGDERYECHESGNSLEFRTRVGFNLPSALRFKSEINVHTRGSVINTKYINTAEMMSLEKLPSNERLELEALLPNTRNSFEVTFI